MGNGSTYRMIPSIFAALGRDEADDEGPTEATAVEFKRQAAAVIGIAGAIGAFGGFLIQVVLRQASLGCRRAVKAAETPAEKVAVAAGQRRLVDPGAVGVPRRLRRLRRDDVVRLPAPVASRPSGCRASRTRPSDRATVAV